MKPVPDLCDMYPEAVRVLEPIFSSYGGRKRFSGPIVTVRCFEDNSLVKTLANTPGNGRVMVVDGGGSMRRACLGDMLAAKASRNGWSGFLIYGCIRDVDEISSIGIGVQALGVHPMKTEKRGVGEQQITVSFAGVTIHPHEFLYADSNGVIVSNSALD